MSNRGSASKRFSKLIRYFNFQQRTVVDPVTQQETIEEVPVLESVSLEASTDVTVSGKRVVTTANNSISAESLTIDTAEVTYNHSDGSLHVNGNALAFKSDVGTVNGNTVWHEGNDGSGSGLDADKVDGLQASQFLRSDATDSFTDLSGTSITLTGDLTVSGGDIVLNGTGRIQGIDTVSCGTDAANKNYVDNVISSSVPAGAIMSFAMTSPPTGWLVCNGATVNRSTYSALFSNIGTTWGSGNGSTTFKLPDLRGVFLRGTGTGTINGRSKAGPSVGNFQEDQFQGHWHESLYSINRNINSNRDTRLSNSGENYTDNSFRTARNPATGSNGGVRYGNETYPYNAGVLYCIKY